jgi:hypothetical protein
MEWLENCAFDLVRGVLEIYDGLELGEGVVILSGDINLSREVTFDGDRRPNGEANFGEY